MSRRAYRFGVHCNQAGSGPELAELARRAEGLGYDSFTVADHFRANQLAPLVAMTAAAMATTTLRIGSLVLDNDYRHPLVLAKELATLDVLCEGRLQVGLGAGWLREDYDWSGIPYDPPAVRVDRFEEGLRILKGLWADGPFSFAGKHYRIADHDGTPKPRQRPHPPILIGAGGRRMLRIAAREADIVNLSINQSGGSTRPGDLMAHPDNPRADGFDARVHWLREAAGARFEQLELSAFSVVTLAPDRSAALGAMARAMGVGTDWVEASPQSLIGSAAEIERDIEAKRARYGITYWVFPIEAMDALAPLVKRLAGRRVSSRAAPG